MIATTSNAQVWEAVGAMLGGIGTVAVAITAVWLAQSGRSEERRRAEILERLQQLDQEITDRDETRLLLTTVKRDPLTLRTSPQLFAAIVNALAHHSQLESESDATDVLARLAQDFQTGLDVIEEWIEQLTEQRDRLAREHANLTQRLKGTRARKRWLLLP